MPNHSATTLRTLFSILHTKIESIDLDSLNTQQHLLISEALGICTQIAKLLTPETAAAAVTSVAAKAVKEEATPAPDAGAAEKKTILVIDDDVDIHKVLLFLLQRKGNFSVLSETNPAKALEKLSSGVFAPMPDIILMDLMMPQMTGFDLLSRIRAKPNLAGIKIMIGSSRSYDKDRIAVLQAGANEFIAKPYNFEELLLRLNKLAH